MMSSNHCNADYDVWHMYDTARTMSSRYSSADRTLNQSNELFGIFPLTHIQFHFLILLLCSLYNGIS
jgi:hypothetical protein